MKKSSENLKKRVHEIRDNGYIVYKGYCLNALSFGWIMKPFGGHESYLGKNLNEAWETLDTIEFENNLT